jgi:hypothetical protein
MLEAHTLPAAADPATIRPDVVVFSCTSAGALRGRAYETRLCREIAATTHAPVVSTMDAVRGELVRLGVRSVTVVTPYPESLTGPVRAGLEAEGLAVPAAAREADRHPRDRRGHAGRDRPLQVETFRRGRPARLRGLLRSGVDARDAIAAALRVPVVTSNQATPSTPRCACSATDGLSERRGERRACRRAIARLERPDDRSPPPRRAGPLHRRIEDLSLLARGRLRARGDRDGAGSRVTVTWNEVPTHQHPPLHLWLVRGPSTSAQRRDLMARPHGDLALGTLVLTWRIRALTVGRAAATAGMASLLATPIFVDNARRLMMGVHSPWIAATVWITWRRVAGRAGTSPSRCLWAPPS